MTANEHPDKSLSMGGTAYPSPKSLASPSLAASPSTTRRPYHFSTRCATVENPDQKDQYGSTSVPIYQTATFKGIGGQYDYTRSGNPTRSHLEHHLAKIYSAQHAFTVSSGMAALDIITRLLKAGDEVIAGDDLYGGTNRLLSYLREHIGVTVHHIDTTDPTAIHPLVVPDKTAMVLLESPTNPLLKIADLAQIAADVKLRAPNAIVVVDNTMMSPYLQRPLELGADIVYDSGTKYLSGHHDLMAGVITCNRDDLAKKIAFLINAVGNALNPFDSFLLLRGTKTLAIRMDRQQSSALSVAEYLDRIGFKVHYPGLKNHPGKDIHDRLATGAGAVLSFTTGEKALSERIVGGTRLWGISVSFGAVNSLISMPCAMSHASIDAATRAARGLPEDLVRLCVGIEDPEDLIDDLENALIEAGVSLPTLLDVPPDVDSRVNNPTTSQISTLSATKQAVNSANNEWFVSAPGKVILFGEHAVVYGVTAIAASVDLRCYGLASPRNDGIVSLHLPDLNGWQHEWTIDELPWDAVTIIPIGEEHPQSLDSGLIEAITTRALPQNVNSPEFNRAKSAAIAFLYLYMVARHDTSQNPSFNFVARSTLPIGAGLGSSASYSSCIAATTLLFHRRSDLSSNVLQQGDCSNGQFIPSSTAEEINRWAFIAEKIMHGNPSGVDNTVSVLGGAISFSRGVNGKKGSLESIQGFKSVNFLLTDSKVSRDTKKLVAGVATKLQEDPAVVRDILSSIQTISDEAFKSLSDPNQSREDLLSGLSALMHDNHRHLVSLGVSHPSLEHIREITGSFDLTTKLTGAGGGGCAVTLVPDGFQETARDILVANLQSSGYQPYLTTVGGRGLGVVALEPHMNSTLQLPRADVLAQKPRESLANWAEDQGDWLYV